MLVPWVSQVVWVSEAFIAYYSEMKLSQFCKPTKINFCKDYFAQITGQVLRNLLTFYEKLLLIRFNGGFRWVFFVSLIQKVPFIGLNGI